MKYSYAQKRILNSKIAYNIHNWMTVIVPEWIGGVHGHNERIPTWHKQDGTKVMACEDYEPTENTDQAFELLVEWDLLGSNIGYLMAAGIEVTDQFQTKSDVHSLSRIAICEAALACNFDTQNRLNKFEKEIDYAY